MLPVGGVLSAAEICSLGVQETGGWRELLGNSPRTRGDRIFAGAFALVMLRLNGGGR